MLGAMRRAFSAISVVVLGLLIITSTASSQGAGQLAINAVDIVPQPAQCAYQVRTFVSALDADRDPILGLSPSDFTVVEDGVSREPSSVAPADQGMVIVLALDKSGSMDRQDKLGVAKQAINEFLRSLEGRKDQVAAYSFDEQVDLESDFTDDPNQIINQGAIDSIRPGAFAGTCLYDAAFEAVDKAAEVRKGRRAVVLLTDGIDEVSGGGPCSSKTVDDVIDRTQELDVPLYLIGLGEADVDPQVLQRIADLSGGQFWLAPDGSELNAIYQRIADQLKNQLVLTYLSSGASGEHTLVVKAQPLRQGELSDTTTFNAPVMEPAIAGLSLSEGQDVSSDQPVRVNVPCPANVVRAEFYLDGTKVGEDPTPPFELDWGSTSPAPGSHQLRTVVFNSRGQQADRSISVSVPPPPSPTASTSTLDEEPENEPPSNLGAEENPNENINITATISSVASILLERLPTWAWIAIPALLILSIGLIVIAGRRRDTHRDFYPEDSIFQPLDDMPTEDLVEEEATHDVYAPEGMPDLVAELTVVRSLDLRPGESFDLFARSVTIGRGVDNDFIIPDSPVSRRHAELRYHSGRFSVHDLESKYGTMVNGARVPPEGMWLENGDRVQFGTRTVFEYRAQSPTGDWAQPEEDYGYYDSEETQRLGGERGLGGYEDYYYPDEDEDQDHGPTTERY